MSRPLMDVSVPSLIQEHRVAVGAALVFGLVGVSCLIQAVLA